MKMISQKHTSKFVAGFLQGLGLVACVSFTSCGESDDKEKKEKVDQEKEKLKKSIKEAVKKGNGKITDDQIDKIANYYSKDGNKFENLVKTELTKCGLSDSEIKVICPDQPKKKDVKVKVFANKVNVGGDEVNFNDLESLKNFVSSLKNNNVEVEDGPLIFVFENNEISICGGNKIAFNEDLVKVFVDLMSFSNLFKSFGLEVKKDKKVYFGDKEVPEALCKKGNFWNLVKGYTAVFGVSDKNKFSIDNNNNNVVIDDFESELKYDEVVKSGKVDGEWNKIFKLKA